MYETRDFSAMPILADALQDAGCDNDDILSHCRDAGRSTSAAAGWSIWCWVRSERPRRRATDDRSGVAGVRRPDPMLELLKGKTGERKLRLAICAFCSHIKVVTGDDIFHAAFNASEQYADKLVSWEAVEKLAARINQFARHGDSIQQTAAVLPVYLLSRDADLITPLGAVRITSGITPSPFDKLL